MVGRIARIVESALGLRDSACLEFGPQRRGCIPWPAARVARSGTRRCAAAQRDVCRRPARLGSRRSRRHLAHHGRRPPLGAATLGSRLPAVGRRVHRRPHRLGGGRIDQTVQPCLARRLARDARRRRALADRSQPDAAGAAEYQILRSEAWLGDRAASALFPTGVFTTENGGQSSERLSVTATEKPDGRTMASAAG